MYKNVTQGGVTMAKEILSEELWEIIQPLLPKLKPRRFMYPGRKKVDDRKALTGILFVLITGIGWEYLPKEMGCGSGMTCWRRLRDWNEAGVWENLHKVLLQYLQKKEKNDWSRAIIDSSSARAVFGGSRQDQVPLTGEKMGVNTTFSPMAKAPHSHRKSHQLIGTM